MTDNLPTESDDFESPAVPPSVGASLLEKFLMGNYFYPLSAVAFMLGCYLLMTSPYISGSIFIRTLKSFLVLQGYECILLASAALITYKLGRGGDVVTLFLIGLVLTLDPTFFANAFYTIRQDVNPAYPLWVCSLALAAAISKLLVYKQLLRLQTSWRFCAGFLLAACMVWLSGLFLARDHTVIAATWYCYALAWVPLLVTIVTGEARHVHLVPQSVHQSRDWPSLFVAGMLPLLCAFHQIEITTVSNVNYSPWLMSPLFVTVAFAFIRNARPANDDGQKYRSADVFAVFALLVSLNGRGQIVAGLMMPSPLILAAIGVGGLFGYGYWKHRSRIARLHLIAYAGAVVAVILTWVIVKYGIPLIRKINLPAIPADVLTFPSFMLLLTALLVGAAFIKRTLILCLLAAWSTIVLLGGFVTGGYTNWILELVQLMVLALFIYYYAKGPDIENLKKTAIVLIAVSLLRFVFFPNPVAYGFLLTECIILLILSKRMHNTFFAILAIIGFVIAGLETAKYTITSVHPSIAALGVGILLFAAGLWVTFQKAKLLAAVAQSDPPTTAPPDGDQSSSSGEMSDPAGVAPDRE